MPFPVNAKRVWLNKVNGAYFVNVSWTPGFLLDSSVWKMYSAIRACIIQARMAEYCIPLAGAMYLITFLKKGGAPGHYVAAII